MNDEVLLEVKGLCEYFKLGKKTLKAVDGVSFTLKRGEAFGLVGESGSGKTTTGRTIIGLYEPTAGEVFFEGKDITHAKGKERRRLAGEMQMIFQDPVSSLNPRMTVGEIVAEGLKIAGRKNLKKIREEVEETLWRVGILPKYAGRYPHEFSGGQRQRRHGLVRDDKLRFHNQRPRNTDTLSLSPRKLVRITPCVLGQNPHLPQRFFHLFFYF